MPIDFNKVHITLTREQLTELIHLGADAVFYRMIHELPLTGPSRPLLLRATRDAQWIVTSEWLRAEKGAQLEFDENKHIHIHIPEGFTVETKLAKGE